MTVKNSTNINKTMNTSHLNSLNTNNTTTFDLGNPGPSLGQAQKCDAVKPKKKTQCFLCLKRFNVNKNKNDSNTTNINIIVFTLVKFRNGINIFKSSNYRLK